jgi:hypothetical protein
LRWRRLALAVLVLALAPAAQADAYRLQKHRWYAKTLTYYDATGIYRDEVRAAARAWNRSGARVRIRSASRRSARVVIRVDRRMRSGGVAAYRSVNGIVSRASIRVSSDLKRAASEPEGRAAATAVIAHEFAHVLGLRHENRRCALMNSVLWHQCGRASETWRYRCRTLEADDVRGLVRRFGGRVRARGAEFCDAEPAPGLATDLAVTTVDPTQGLLRISWRTPANAARVRLLRRAGECPAGPADPQAQLVAAGVGESVNDQVPAPDRYCYAVMGEGPLGRPGPLAVAVHDFAGVAPVARFDWFAHSGTSVTFIDQSSDGDGRIVAWRWDFGDATSSAEQAPDHAYPAPGDYTVTLTVTDDSGHTHSVTEVVTAS